MSESAMRSNVLRMLRPLAAFPVENLAQPGTPDVAYRHGWLELKWLRSWPRTASTHVKFDFTPQQRYWLLNWRRAGGQAWFMVQCSNEWILIDGAVAALKVGTLSRAGLAMEIAEKYWGHGIDEEELRAWLSHSHRQSAYCLSADDEASLKRGLLAATGSPSADT